LATGLPEDQVRSINLDYLDTAEVDPDAWAADPDTLVVPRAGEVRRTSISMGSTLPRSWTRSPATRRPSADRPGGRDTT
jgi:hypothetical protein